MAKKKSKRTRGADRHADEESPRKSRRQRAVMADSGQTDTERRILRSDQRRLHDSITTGPLGDEMEDSELGAFREVRDSNNAMFERVNYTREAALDGQNFQAITSRAVRQVDRLIKLNSYDAAKFCRKLREKCSSERGRPSFDWAMLGRECGACFNAVPMNSFMNGPVEKEIEIKVRQKRQAKPKMDKNEKEERPEELEKIEKSGNELSAVEDHLKVLSKTLCRRVKQEAEKVDGENKKKVKICAVKFLMNPKSFTQTVENIFHFSYLVKGGKASIGVDKNTGLPVVRPTVIKDKSVGRQSVVAFNMSDWRRLNEAFDISEGDLPDRG